MRDNQIDVKLWGVLTRSNPSWLENRVAVNTFVKGGNIYVCGFESFADDKTGETRLKRNACPVIEISSHEGVVFAGSFEELLEQLRK